MSYTFEVGKELLAPLVDAPDSQLDKTMCVKLSSLLATAQDIEQLRTGLYEILDYCARYALASSFIMKHFHYTWTGLGGKVGDPAPWREPWEP